MVFTKPFNLLKYMINDNPLSSFLSSSSPSSSTSSSSFSSSSSSSATSSSSSSSAEAIQAVSEALLSSITNTSSINEKDEFTTANLSSTLSSSIIQDTLSTAASSISTTVSSSFSDTTWLSSAIYNTGLSSLNISSPASSLTTTTATATRPTASTTSSLSLLSTNSSISSSLSLSSLLTSSTTNLFSNYNDLMNNSSIENNETTLYTNNYNFYNNYYNYTGDIFELSPCDPSNIAFNCSIDEFLLYARGPQQLPLGTALLVTILFVGIFVTGVVGNVIVCIVIVRHSTMHTATNYYLFSLAISDLIFLMMGLPYEISLYWHQYPYNLGLPFCKIRALISEASTYVSVLTIVAFSMERFLAICHPLHLYTMSGFKRALRIIAALWVISFLSAIPFAVFTKIDFLKYPVDNSTIHKSAFCAMLENPPGFPLWELSSCLFFVIPMVLIMVLYGRMGYQIRSRTRHSIALGVQQGSMHKESRHQQSRKAIIRMLAAVVITFFVCWAPFHAQRLMYLYARDWAYFQDFNTWLFSVAGWFYYVSCTINPILYNVMSHRYRVAFKETLCGRRKGYYQNNGFARDQSSFRETTINSSAGYENSHLVRIRSMRNSHYIKNRDPSIKSGMLWRSNTICSKPIIKEDDKKLKMNHQNNSKNNTNNVVVVVDNDINGRTKIFTENNAQENLLKKDETYI